METVDPTSLAPRTVPLRNINLNHHTHVHNNSVTFNAAYGDELNSTTPSSAGGVTSARLRLLPIRLQLGLRQFEHG